MRAGIILIAIALTSCSVRDRVVDLWQSENEKPVCGIGFIHDSRESRLQPACAYHDWCYEHQEQHSFTRQECDDALLTAWLKVAVEQKRFIDRLWLLNKINLYWALVEKFGPVAWDSHETVRGSTT